GSITQNAARENTRTTLAVVASKADQAAIAGARQRLMEGAVGGGIPEFSYFNPAGDANQQVHKLLQSGEERVTAVLTGGLASPSLAGAVNGNDGSPRQTQLQAGP